EIKQIFKYQPNSASGKQNIKESNTSSHFKIRRYNFGAVFA
ncbi:hypothetical protein Leryth_003368, partial [Lithospermum erythrorhizon]